jgi:ubiquitin carboxyl-terminal hydrolase 7
MFVPCRYVGRSFVKGGGRPTDILEKLNEMAGFEPTEEIQLYEVSSCLACELCELFQL